MNIHIGADISADINFELNTDLAQISATLTIELSFTIFGEASETVAVRFSMIYTTKFNFIF